MPPPFLSLITSILPDVVFLFQLIVIIDDLPDILPLLGVRLVEERTLVPVDNHILQLFRRDVEIIDRELEFLGDAGMRDEAVIGAECDREAVVEHFTERVIL